jgi:predicted nucleic-acid-binding Zn-ribbon protein
MKSTGMCPKCSSKKIATIPSELGTYNVIKVGMFGFAKLTRYICTSCGYLEQYVADEKSIVSLRQKSKN